MSIVLAACGPGPVRRPARRPDAGVARVASEVAPPPTTLLHGLAQEPSALALATSGERRALVVDLPGERRLVRADGSARSWPRAEASALRFVVATSESLAIASLDASAPDDRLEILRTDGSEAEPPALTVSFSGHLATMRRASSGSLIYVAASEASGPVHLARFELEPSRASAEVAAVERADELGREIVGLAADASGPALLFRRGVPEDAAGAVVLVTERGAFPVEALHDLALLESIEREGDSVSIVGAFEFDRPRAFRFDRRGRLLDARRLAPGDEVPFVRTRLRAELDAEPGAVVVRLRALDGELRAQRRFPRSSGTTLAAIARERHGFVVAWTERLPDGWAVRVEEVPEEAR